MIGGFLAAALVVALGAAGAAAGLLPLRGGTPPATAAPAFACDGSGSGVCADFANGQTGLQWPDARDPITPSQTDYAKRYSVYESLSSLNSGNCTSGTLVGKYILPNSGQLTGGNPDSGTGQTYTQAHRQANDSSNPMAKIPDAASAPGTLKQLAYATGLHVRKVPGTRNAYYCVVSTDTSAGSPSYIGAVGPIAESASPARGVLYAQRTTGVGHITYSSGLPTGTSGLPIVVELHPSESSGGSATNSDKGDYFEWFGDTSEGWQEGVQRTFDVFKDRVSGTRYTSLPNTLVVGTRDTIWNPVGTGGLETYHSHMGMTPLVGTANRISPATMTSYKRFLSWVCDPSYYGADCNQVHATGYSLGAIGGALITSHPSDGINFASVWMGHPLFRLDLFRESSWAAELWGGTCASPWAFSATFGCPTFAAPYTMGKNASTALMSDGSTVANYFNLPAIWGASPGDDLPFFGGQDAKDDLNLTAAPSVGPGSFQQIIDGVVALQTAHRGHALTFFMGQHNTTYPSMQAINCDWNSAGTVGICYSKSLFALNKPYAAFDGSSLDDIMAPGNVFARDSAGIATGDPVGCINCGFTWNFITDTAGTLRFTVGNGWMTRAATTIPATTISGAPSTGDTCTAGGTVPLTEATFGGNVLTVGQNNWFKIGTGANAEIFFVNSISGGNLNVTARCQNGSTHHPHIANDPIIQYPSLATGPNIGPQTAMTANVTPRRLQGFVKPNGTSVSCTVTPFGGSPSTIIGTVVGSNGVFTLPAVPINAGGVTDIACS